MSWYFDETGNFVRLKKDSRILANVAMAKTYEEQLRNGRLMAAALEMYELLREELIPTSDYGGIVSFERERKIKKVLARIDGKENEEAEHDCY